jgi:tetratricopeptide (TPR) repeat protein
LHRSVLLLQLLAALAFTAVPGALRADELQDFELARSRYDVGSYQEAADQFAKLLDPKAPRYLQDGKLRQQARVLYAASLVALNRMDEADDTIATLLREDTSYQLTPGLFPQQVVDRFIAVRAKLRTELDDLARKKLAEEQQRELARQQARAAQTKRVAELERLASEERVTVVRSRWIAAIPFGVGQFQNDADALGWFFATSETLMVAASIVSGVIAYDYASVRCGDTEPDPTTGRPVPVDCDRLSTSFLTARTVNWISFGTAAALAVAGIIEAEVSLEPEQTEVRKRELPPSLKVTPTAAVADDGVLLGIEGRF